MTCGESNGHVTTDNVAWPRKVKLMTTLRLSPISRKLPEMLF